MNNYEEGDCDKLRAAKWIKYCIVGKEVGEEGTPHLQGYIQIMRKNEAGKRQAWSATKVAKTMKSEGLSSQPHVEIALGNCESNIKYCSKEGDVTEWGVASKGKGSRTDIKQFLEAAKTKDTLELAEEYPKEFARYNRAAEKIRQAADEKAAEDWRELDVTLLTGPTGCGKTRRAMESGGDIYKIQGDEMTWWDGYRGQKTLLIDEYSNDVKVTKMLSVLDGYKLRLPIKGGFTYARWTKVFITTNLRQLHEQAKEAHQQALARRINNTVSYWEHAGISAMAATETEDDARCPDSFQIDDDFWCTEARRMPE